jgi:hypothetical protein
MAVECGIFVPEGEKDRVERLEKWDEIQKLTGLKQHWKAVNEWLP